MSGRAGRQTCEQVQRLLVAAGPDHAHRGQLVGLRGVVGIKHDRRARFSERLLDARIGFLLECGIERGQRALLARFEHGLRRLEALGGIGGLQAQAADRGIERAPHPVVDAHVGEVGRVGAVRRRTGRGVDQLAGLVPVKNLLLFGAVGQPAVLQRLDDGDGARIAGRRDFGNSGVGLGEIILEEMRQSAGKAGLERGPAELARQSDGADSAAGAGCAATGAAGATNARAKEKRIATRRSGKTRIAVFSRRLILGRRR